jgi:serine/threonine-protein kinase
MILPGDAPLDTSSGLPAVALSPAGDLLVYAATDRGGRRLYARRMDRMEAAPLPGTDGAAGPFFSPDGSWVGYFAAGRLRKVSLGGLPAEEIADAPRPGGAAWGNDGTIVAVLSIEAGPVRLPDDGGPPQPVRMPGRRPGSLILFPDLLPGGRLALVTLAEGSGGAPSIAVLNLESGETRVVLERAAGGRFAPTGHLLHVREGTLIAAPFDIAKAAVSGRAVPVQSGVLADLRSGASHFAMAGDGTLVYVPQETAATDRRLVRVDRSGAVRPLTPDRAAFEHPRPFAAGRSLVVSVAEAARLSLWICDLQDGSHRVLPSDVSLTLPLPSPDGGSIAYVSPRAGAWNLFRRPLAGLADPALLYSSDNPLSPSSWSPDGRRLLFTEIRPDTNGDILVIESGARAMEPGAGSGSEGGAQPIVSTPADEWGGTYSPDGRLIAYTTSASGRREVFVRPAAAMPSDSAIGGPVPVRVSDGEGFGAVWGPRGGELFFRRGDELLAVTVRGWPPVVGAPRVLFGGNWEGESAALPNYAVFPDGGSFVMVEGRTQSAGATQINVVIDWFEDLRRQVAIGQE